MPLAILFVLMVGVFEKMCLSSGWRGQRKNAIKLHLMKMSGIVHAIDSLHGSHQWSRSKAWGEDPGFAASIPRLYVQAEVSCVYLSDVQQTII